MAKLSRFEYFVNIIIVSMKCDDLTFVTLENVMNVKSSHFFSQTLEFSLNGAALSLNSVNSGNSENLRNH